ncbi:hypothetical protein [Microbacterium cremeum]|uniref:hypothetical protein n=1 Tax=Microbacterium cremeum TaxID=2782169 RepID=UPI0018872495|nr:hypothetical protein [Microbacterium cremeum]
MTRVAFEHDEATSIVLPADDLGEGAAAWADEAIARLAVHHDFGAGIRETLARALVRAQRSAVGDPATDVLLFERGTGSWVPLRLTLLERELDADEQSRYLRPDGVLPPRLRTLVSQGLGPGCSSTVVESEGRGSVRWLFLPAGLTFFAVLAPMAAPAIPLAAAIAEGILDTVRIEGGGGVSAAFDPQALVDAGASDDVSWRM